MNADRQQEKARLHGLRYSAGQAALQRLFNRYVRTPRIVWGPNPHHAAGRSRTGGIPWPANGRKAKAR